MKGKFLVTEKEATHKDAINLLERSGFSISYTTPGDLLQSSEIGAADVFVVNVYTKIGRDVLDKAKNLKAIIACCSGIDKIDAGECGKRGIKIYNSPGANANAVAEHAIALMLSVLRRLPQADRSVKSGKWERDAFMSYELEGKTVGIVGFGAIGKSVAKKLAGFGVKMIAFDPFLAKEEVESFGGLKVRKAANIEELVKESNIITVHVPLSDDTKYLIGKKEFATMKRDAVIINTSRGAVINEKALMEALKSKKIFGAGLDVFENEPPIGSELLRLENVVLTPHTAAMTEEAFREACVKAVKNFLDGHGK